MSERINDDGWCKINISDMIMIVSWDSDKRRMQDSGMKQLQKRDSQLSVIDNMLENISFA